MLCPCLETMTTVGACFIHEVYITMLRRWQLMEHDSYQLTEHVLYMMDISPCSDRCHETMTTDGSFFITKGCITMLGPLP